jgi:hypothetical protein
LNWIQLLNQAFARLGKRRYRSQETLFHNTLGLTIAALDPVAWLIGYKAGQKVGHAVDAVEGLGGPINQGSTLFREDANLHPNKVTDPKAIVCHAERTYIGCSKFPPTFPAIRAVSLNSVVFSGESLSQARFTAGGPLEPRTEQATGDNDL